MKEEEKKQGRLVGTINSVVKSIKSALGKKEEQTNYSRFSMTKTQWYYNSGLMRKNYKYKRKTQRFKTNYISNRKIK